MTKIDNNSFKKPAMNSIFKRIKSLNQISNYCHISTLLVLIIASGLALYFVDKHIGRHLIVISSAIALILIFISKRARLKFDESFLWPMTLFIFLLSLLISFIVHQGGVDSKRFYEALEILSVGGAIYFFLLTRQKSIHAESIFWLLAAGSVFTGIAGLALWEEYGFNRRISLGSSMINISAGTQIILLASVLAFAVHRVLDWKTIILVIAIVLEVVGIFASGSRGAWLGILVIFVLAGFWVFMKRGAGSTSLIILTLLFVSALAILQATPQVEKRLAVSKSDFQEYISDSTNRKSSVSLRFEMWRSAYDGFIQNPLTGMGGAKLGLRWHGQEHDYKILNYSPHVHNDILEAAQSRGLLGMVGVLLILFTPMYLGWRYREGVYGKVLVTVTCGFGLVCLFDTHLVMKFSLFYYVVLVSLVTALMLNQKIQCESNSVDINS